MASRVFQVVVESVTAGGTARAYQVVVEAIADSANAARAHQVVIEALVDPLADPGTGTYTRAYLVGF